MSKGYSFLTAFMGRVKGRIYHTVWLGIIMASALIWIIFMPFFGFLAFWKAIFQVRKNANVGAIKTKADESWTAARVWVKKEFFNLSRPGELKRGGWKNNASSESPMSRIEAEITLEMINFFLIEFPLKRLKKSSKLMNIQRISKLSFESNRYVTAHRLRMPKLNQFQIPSPALNMPVSLLQSVSRLSRCWKKARNQKVNFLMALSHKLRFCRAFFRSIARPRARRGRLFPPRFYLLLLCA